ncbi:MAG: hypothetical protein JXR97_02995 [Planctomycetes bacterium]|nr:hypothetical protein [Planctomycetota bacterium]
MHDCMTNPDLGAFLWRIQQGLPLESSPFSIIGSELGLSESSVIDKISGLFDKGLIRRVGGVFDSRRLGYSSTLCAARVDVNELAKVASLFATHSGITHSYERKLLGSTFAECPNLWFTLTAPAETFASSVEALRESLRPYPLLDLPAICRFKLQVLFRAADMGVENGSEVQPEISPAGTEKMDSTDMEIVRNMQGSVPLVARLYAEIAGRVGISEDDLLLKLRRWNISGALRRVAAILRHRRAGYSANGMCVWAVPENRIEEKGHRLAAVGEVTHCYARAAVREFPYNLFAMIHAGSEEELCEKREQTEREAGLVDGRMLLSVREFKKTSPVFFSAESVAARPS